MAYSISSSLIANTVLQESYLDEIAQSLAALSVHNHSGSLGEGSNVLNVGACSVSGSLVYRHEIMPTQGDHLDGILGSNKSYAQSWPLTYWIDASGAAGASAVFDNISTACFLPRNCIWGFEGPTVNPVAGIGCRMALWLATGSYNLTMYYMTYASGGTLRISQQEGAASTIIREVDTYSAAIASAVFTTCFYNAGSLPFTLNVTIGASKNGSATACYLLLGAMCVQWTGS